MTKGTALLTFLLFACAAQTLGAQPFKAGDHVEAKLYDQWLPCTVLKPELNWLVPGSTAIRAYTVTCVVNAASGPQESSVAVTDVRARAATAEDKSAEAETSAALARQPKGNSVGAKYGTRDPRTCASRTAPGAGAPSAAQATQYVICELEQGDGLHKLSLVTGVKVQVASVSHPPNNLIKDLRAADIDPSQPVWDIRGSFTSYSCQPLNALVAQNDFARAHNCWSLEQPTATGYCYKNTFGDWHCGLLGNKTDWKTNVLPPAGN